MVRRKTAAEEAFQSLPEIKDSQFIGKIAGIRGNGLFDCEHVMGNNTILVSLPSRFMNAIWVKRGCYVIVEPIKDSKTKVTGEIVFVLYAHHIKQLKRTNQWPVKDEEESDVINYGIRSEQSASDEDLEDDDLFVNRNHIAIEEDQ